MEQKKKLVVMLLLLAIATVGVIFAVFTFSKDGTVENMIESSNVVMMHLPINLVVLLILIF